MDIVHYTTRKLIVSPIVADAPTSMAINQQSVTDDSVAMFVEMFYHVNAVLYTTHSVVIFTRAISIDM